jgi:hypothetical protein
MQQSLCAAGGKCELMLLDGDHFIVADVLTNESILIGNVLLSSHA